MKIIHVINSLEIGGAEMMLLKLLNSGIYSNDEILILVLTKNTVLTEKIRKLGFNVEHFNFSKNFHIFREAIKFYKRIKTFSPDIVQSWLYQANLISGLSCFFLKIKNIWSIRQTSLDSKHNKICFNKCKQPWGDYGPIQVMNMVHVNWVLVVNLRARHMLRTFT